MQSTLWDGKTVRDISYKNIINQSHTDIQREIVGRIIASHPEGITDREICMMTGIRLSSVNARRNELSNIGAVGIAVYTDDHGDSHLNTLWGIENYLNEPPPPYFVWNSKKVG